MLRPALLPLLWAAAAIQAAAAAPRIPFDVPEGAADVTLEVFARQAGARQPLLYSTDAVRGVRTRAVRGEWTPFEALQRMLAGGPLRAVEDEETGALAVEAAGAPGSERGVPSDSRANEAVIKLTPFEVQADPRDSYGALQSNALTAFGMDLERMPATAEIFTDTFMRDTHALTVEDMLIAYAGVVGYNPGDPGAYTASEGDRDGSGGLSLRGFSASALRFDGFFGPTTGVRSNAGATPAFAIERVEVVEGPQSLLYGAIGGGGVINAVSKRAIFGVRRGEAETSFNDLGGKDAGLDVNVGGGRLALRVAATLQDNPTVRQNLGSTTAGVYAQAGLRLGDRTVVRIQHGKYETVATNGFNPSLAPFFPAGSPLAGDTAPYLAATGRIPPGAAGGALDWDNVSSLAGAWGREPIVNDTTSLVVESSPLPWLSVRVNAVYNEMTDWRDQTTLALEPGSAAGNPYGTTALMTGIPNFGFQSQREKGIQVQLLADDELFGGSVRSQTLLGGYLNHVGPAYGSSGITYVYAQADSSWKPLTSGNPNQDYGRILLSSQWIPVAGGRIDRYPLFDPLRSRLSYGGANYVLVPRIQASAARKTAGNPYGLAPNSLNAATGAPAFTGIFNPGAEEHEHYLDLANYTDWLGGRFQTLAGVSFDRAITQNNGATLTAVVPWTTYAGYEFGVVWQLDPFLGAYATYGTAASPSGTTNDLIGRSLAAPNAGSAAPELGLKAHSRDRRYLLQLAWEPATRDRNEVQAVDPSYQGAVNPNGINGRFGGAGTNNFVNVDRTSTSVELTASADPLPGWRIRTGASYLFARVTNAVAYRQLYNDQFRTNAQGQVTYANGNVVNVDGTASSPASAAIALPSAPGATPLTVAMINAPSGAYYAAPDPTSGSITNAGLQTILTTGGAAGSVGAQQVAANGESATGATGLPLSAIQYAFASPFPNAVVPVFSPGDLTTGYPGWQWNLETDYTRLHGVLKGWGAFLGLRAQYSTRAFYTYYPAPGPEGSEQVNETRSLTTLPVFFDCSAALHYSFSVLNVRVTTRLKVDNLFNHDRIDLFPQASNGTFRQAVQRDPPRLWTWINEIDF